MRAVVLMAYTNHYKSARRQNWTTPHSLFDKLHEEFQFTLDGASDSTNGLLDKSATVREPQFWLGERVFCNPPWSDIRPYVEQAALADLAVLLVPARCNSRWFHRALELGAEVRFFLGRPRFGGASSNSPVDCVLLIFRRGDA
jgi:hypothetical protein